jgi:MerR family transcriptional regulator, heat shock protein HspR
MSSEQHYLEPRGSGGWSWSHRRPTQPEEPEPLRFEETDDYDAPVYVISVAADLADLHPQTLRAYEREGLLTPARTEGGTRRYSRRDVDRLRFIRTLTQDEGLNIAGVRVVLEMGEKLEAARHRIHELEDMVRALAERIEQRPAGDRVEIVKSAPAHVEAHPHLRRRTGQRSARVADARAVPPRHAASD